MNVGRFVRWPLWVLRDLAMLVITYTPGPTGSRFRRWYYRRALGSCGQNVTIDVGVLIESPALVSIGNNVHIDKYCVIATGTELVGNVTSRRNESFRLSEGQLVVGDNVHIVQHCIIMAYGGVEIGDNCTLSAGAKIYSLTNTAYDADNPERVISIMPYEQAPFLAAPVVLEQNVWLGLNVIVMPGVTIGRDSFAVSNSLILSSFPENSYLQGQPAQRTRSRFSVRHS